MKISCITEFSKEKLRGMRVLVRSELDTPHTGNGIVDPQRALRLDSSLKTIKYLSELGARVVVVSHIGREPKNTLKDVSKELSKRIGSAIGFVPDIFSEDVTSIIETLPEGGILVLENLRSYAQEKNNDKKFAEYLSSLADIYVIDAFSNAHRKHASMVGVTEIMETYSGIQFHDEVTFLKDIRSPKVPFVVIMGGFKVATKMPVIETMREKGAEVYVCGALAHPLLKARGYNIGASICDQEADVSALVNDSHIHSPKKVLVRRGGKTVDILIEEVRDEDVIMDLSPSAFHGKFAEDLKNANTILWNGPLGLYEKGYTKGSEALLEILADVGGVKIAGGSDTISAIKMLGYWDSFDFISMAGGATLHYLAHGTLPILEVLESKK